jgi:hypothetical protein
MLSEKIALDQVIGLKSRASMGDYYLGNDFVHIAIAGNHGTSGPGIFTGSIIDAGYITLDGGYNRVSARGNAMGQLTTVMNGSPDLPVVFNDKFELSNDGNVASITMHGAVRDLSGDFTAVGQFVPGVSVSHKISLSSTDRFLTLETKVVNGGVVPIKIYSIGDHLVQKDSGGYNLSVPDECNFDSHTCITDIANSYSREVWRSTGDDEDKSVDSRSFFHIVTPVVGLIDSEYNGVDSTPHANLWFLSLDNKSTLIVNFKQRNYEKKIFIDGLEPELSELAKVNINRDRNGVCRLQSAFCPNFVISNASKVGSLNVGCTLEYSRRIYIFVGSDSIIGDCLLSRGVCSFFDLIHNASIHSRK